jgi:hypothetical protein
MLFKTFMYSNFSSHPHVKQHLLKNPLGHMLYDICWVYFKNIF